VSKAWDPDDIFDVLASEDVRRILVATSVRPMSAKELADICDRSLATIYRRIQAMEDYDLLSEELTNGGLMRLLVFIPHVGLCSGHTSNPTSSLVKLTILIASARHVIAPN
jgi:hypothetical protein